MESTRRDRTTGPVLALGAVCLIAVLVGTAVILKNGAGSGAARSGQAISAVYQRDKTCNGQGKVQAFGKTWITANGVPAWDNGESAYRGTITITGKNVSDVAFTGDQAARFTSDNGRSVELVDSGVRDSCPVLTAD